VLVDRLTYTPCTSNLERPSSPCRWRSLRGRASEPAWLGARLASWAVTGTP